MSVHLTVAPEPGAYRNQWAMVGRLFPLNDRFVSGVDALVDLCAVGLAPLYKGIAWIVAIGVVSISCS
jgi:hypothetical protein